MSNITNLFIDSCNSNTQYSTYKLYFSLGKNGVTLVELNDKDFVTGSGQIKANTNNSNNFNIGGVCATEFTITINRKGVEKLKQAGCLKKKYCIKAVQWNKVADTNQSDSDPSLNKDGSENQSGKCDLGYFYISNINNKDYSCQLEALDGMIAFEKTIPKAKLEFLRQNQKTLTEWIQWTCDECANEYYQVEYVGSKLPVSDIAYNISNDSSIGTYRDLLGYISQVNAGFMTFNRDGLLYLSGYAFDDNSSSIVVEDKQLINYDFDSNVSMINELITSIGGIDWDYKLSDITEIYNEIILSFEENLLLRGIQDSETEFSKPVEDSLQLIADRVYRKEFFGGDITIVPKPFIELGSIITVNHIVVDSDNKITKVTKNNIIANTIVYRFGNSMEIKSNSSVADYTISSQIKQSGVSGGGGSGGSGGNAFLKYLGAKDLNITSGKTEKLFKQYFNLGAGFPCVITITIQINCSVAGQIQFTPIYDGIADLFLPTYDITVGYRVISFTMGFDATERYETHSIDMRITSLGAKLSIEAYKYQMILMASGVKTAGASWTGLYEINEVFTPIPVGNLFNIVPMKDTLGVIYGEPQKPSTSSTTEVFTPISINNLFNIVPMRDSVSVQPYIRHIIQSMLPENFTLSGSATVVDDTSAISGKALYGYGSYPTNSASYEFTISEEKNYDIEISLRGSGYLSIILDSADILIDNVYYSYSNYTTVTKANIELTSGSHTLAVYSTSSSKPYIESIKIIYYEYSSFNRLYKFSVKNKIWGIQFNTDYILEDKDWRLKDTFELDADTEPIDTGSLSVVKLDHSVFSSISEVKIT